MNDQTTQTAVDDVTKAPAQPGAAADPNARKDGDDLNDLLAEYETGTQKEAAPPPAQPERQSDTVNDQILRQVQELRTERQQEVFRRDMDSTIKTVRGDLDPDVFDDEFVEAYLDGRARKDERLRQAWDTRAANPKQFARIAEGLGRDFKKKFGKMPDRAATDDHEAVADAVRGGSTRAPEGKAPDFSGMNNNEFREAHKKAYGYYPSI